MAYRGAAAVAAEDAEIARLERLSRQRPLTLQESERLSELVFHQQRRHSRLGARIEAMRAKLQQLEAIHSGMGIAA